MNLDFTEDELRARLAQLSEAVVDFYAGLRTRPVFHGKTPGEVEALFDEALPQTPEAMEALLRRIETDVVGTTMLHTSPHFYGYIIAGGNPAGFLAGMFVEALALIGGKWQVSAAHAEIERRVIGWIASFIGYDAETGGVLVGGGSMANLTCLAAARTARAPFDVAEAGLNAGPPLTVYTSDEGHSSLEKSVDLLGLGRRHLRRIPTDDAFRIDLAQLEARLRADRAAGCVPFCVVGNAGTTNTGAVDPLDALADLCATHDLWFHVDAAYGGPAAATPRAAAYFEGLARADSVALDPHKWLYVPFAVGCALVRDPEHLRRTFSLYPAYLSADTDKDGRFDFLAYGFQLTRDFKALKVWATFKAYGAPGLAAAIDDNIGVMHDLAVLIDDAADFERLAPAPLSIVCFRYRGLDPRRHTDEAYLNRLNKCVLDAQEADGRVFVSGTELRGKTALRACCVNHRTRRADVVYLLETLRELGRAAAAVCDAPA